MARTLAQRDPSRGARRRDLNVAARDAPGAKRTPTDVCALGSPNPEDFVAVGPPPIISCDDPEALLINTFDHR